MSWKLVLPCTRMEAEAIALAEIENAVLVTTEEDEATGAWRLDAYFDGEPAPATLAAVRALVAAPGDARAEPLAEEDWVTLSQSGLAPIREGCFVVYTDANAAEATAETDAFTIPFRIEAGQAFGTGHHETTSGCLAVLSALADEGHQFGKVIDLGTGTGLLAFAAAALWAMAEVTATDIDPIAIDVTRENAEANDVEIGPDIGEIELIVADGTQHPSIAQGAPYDLVIANILAGPLVTMAPAVAAIAAPRATIILTGLLTNQATAVEAAYAEGGCAIEARLVRGDWTILRLAKLTPSSVHTPAFPA